MNKVSVIVPMYNCRDMVGRCVQSILNQTYKNLEIILVNDGSNDDTYEVCQKLSEQDLRIRLINQLNAGVSAARNCGIDKASGNYVMFVDSDDYLEKTYIAAMVQAADESAAELVISGYTTEKAGEKKIQFYQDSIFENKEDFVKVFGKLYEEYYMRVVWNKLFVRELLINRFDKQISLGEDFLFVLDYLKNAQKIRVIEATGYCYVMTEAPSLTRSFRKNGFEIAELLYKRANDFVADVENTNAVRAIGKMFLDEINAFVKSVAAQSTLTSKEKKELLKKMANNPCFIAELKKCSQLGKRQGIVLYLLKWKWIQLAQMIALI